MVNEFKTNIRVPEDGARRGLITSERKTRASTICFKNGWVFDGLRKRMRSRSVWEADVFSMRYENGCDPFRKRMSSRRTLKMDVFSMRFEKGCDAFRNACVLDVL